MQPSDFAVTNTKQEWSFTVLSNRTVRAYEPNNNILFYIKTGSILFRKDPGDKSGTYFILDGSNNNIYYRININDVVEPAYDDTDIEAYLDRLATLFDSDQQSDQEAQDISDIKQNTHDSNEKLDHISEQLDEIIANTSTNTYSFTQQTFTSFDVSLPIDISSKPMKNFSLCVVGTDDVPSNWNVILQVSIDGMNFTPVLTHNTATGDSITIFTLEKLYPCLYYQINVTDLSLGNASNIVVSVLATK